MKIIKTKNKKKTKNIDPEKKVSFKNFLQKSVFNFSIRIP